MLDAPAMQGWGEFARSTEQSANFAAMKAASAKLKTKAFAQSMVPQKLNAKSKGVLTGSRIMEFAIDMVQGSKSAPSMDVPTDPFAEGFVQLTERKPKNATAMDAPMMREMENLSVWLTEQKVPRARIWDASYKRGKQGFVAYTGRSANGKSAVLGNA